MRFILCRFRAFRELEVENVRLQSRLAEYRGVIESLQESERTSAHLIQSLNKDFAVEQARRLSAEAIAAERGQLIERLEMLVREANASRDFAVSQRAESLNLVNSALLKQLSPHDTPPVDITQFRRIQHEGEQKPAAQAKANRQSIDKFTGDFVADLAKKRAEALAEAERKRTAIPITQATG